MPGLLDNFASNPWLGIGAGLLSAAGPSSRPIGLGKGLMAGLGNMNAMQQAQQQQQLQALKVQQLKAQMAQAAQEQKLEEEKIYRMQRVRGLLTEAIETQDPQLFAQAAAMAGDIGSAGQYSGLLSEKSKPTSAQLDFEYGQENPAFRAWQERMKTLARPTTTVNVGGQGYKWQTKPGEIAADLAHTRTLPPGPERDALEASLVRLQNAQGSGAEARAKQEKIQTVEQLALEFNKIADANPSAVGSLGGTVTDIKTDAGLIGRAVRAVSPTTEAEAAMSAIHNQMLTHLGNALSGAAIPEHEWPKYKAQIPLVTDDKNMRAQKAKMLTQMIGILHDIQEGRKSKKDADALLDEVTGLEGATITIPGS